MTASAAVIANYNLSDFPVETRAPQQVLAPHPDNFLAAVFHRRAQSFEEVVDEAVNVGGSEVQRWRSHRLRGGPERA